MMPVRDDVPGSHLMKSWPILAAVLVLGQTMPAQGRIFSENGRLDRELRKSKLIVVAGVITPTPNVEEKLVLDGGGVSATLRVSHVLLGDPKLKGEDIVFQDQSFMWPHELVKYDPGAYCIVFLGRSDQPEKAKNPFWIRCVAPAADRDLPKTKDVDELRSLLVKQIVKEIKATKLPNRQRHLILQVASIMNAEESKDLLPFLDSKEDWLKRAALASLTYITREEKYIKLATKDVDEFLKNVNPDVGFKGLEEGVSIAPYPLFFLHYFFLRRAFDDEERVAQAAFLSLFRAVARNYNEEWRHTFMECGIEPLCRLGTKDDLATLYRFHDNKDVEIRNLVFRGMSRILKLGLSNYDDDSFLKVEEEFQQKVRDALEREGIVPKK
jgi:hypothetical protein